MLNGRTSAYRLANAATLVAILAVQGCAIPTPAPAPSVNMQAPWEGRFSGTQVPDAIQDATRRRCLTDTVRRTVTIRGGQAQMAFGNEMAVGQWESDGAFHLTTPNRALTLTPTTDAATNKRILIGRLLTGGGPWCKYTFRLEEMPA